MENETVHGGQEGIMIAGRADTWEMYNEVFD